MNNAPDDFRKRKRRPKPGDIGALRRLLWQSALELEKLLQANSLEIKLRAASALATTGGVYLRALEHADLEARLSDLEARVAEGSKK